MVEHDSFEVHLGRFIDASKGFLVVVVQKSGRGRGFTEVFGEEVSSEEDFFFREEQSAMAPSVAGQRDDFEPIDGISGREPLVDFGNLEGEKNAAHFFKPTTEAAPATIAMSGFNMFPVYKWSVNPAAGELLNLSDVEGVVEMPVSQDDTADVREFFVELVEGFFDPRNPSDKSAIDQMHAIVSEDEVMLDNKPAKLDDFSHKRSLPFFC